jgi:hypothetical protein
MAKQVKIELSSCALLDNNRNPGIIARAGKKCDEYGFELGIQIHNTADISQIERLQDYGLPLSFHGPVMTNHAINLAAEDISISLEAFDHTAELMRRFNVSDAVFHGLFMTDSPIPAYGRGKSYIEAVEHLRRPELNLKNSSVCADFFSTEEFKTRLARLKDRLHLIKHRYSGLNFLLENDCPVFISGMMLPEFFRNIEFPVCMDTGHLWATSFVYDRDFLKEARVLIDTADVRMVHLHASVYDEKTPKEKWSDGHKSLRTPNSMKLPELIMACRDAKINNFVFEFNDPAPEDIELFAEMWKG